MGKWKASSEKEFLEAVDRRAAALIKTVGFTVYRLKAAASLRFVVQQCSGMMEAVIDAFKKRDDTIEKLSKRLDDLEAGGIAYKGVWQRAQTYRKGSMVTDGGSAWIAIRATTEGEKPGPSDAWQLAVKAGRDGGAR